MEYSNYSCFADVIDSADCDGTGYTSCQISSLWTDIRLSTYKGSCSGLSGAEGSLYTFISPSVGEDMILSWCLDTTGDPIYLFLHEQGFENKIYFNVLCL